jgi:hypothetical protein
MITQSISLDKFNGHNYHAWRVKTQMQLMQKKVWVIIKGIGTKTHATRQAC